MECKIYLPSGPVVFPHTPTVQEVVEKTTPEKSHQVVGAFINDHKEVFDLRQTLKTGDRIKMILIPSLSALEVIRHSAAHVMAQAVQALWPQTKVGTGPVTENGFYYDFDSPQTFTPQDLKKIETKMKEIIKSRLSVHKEVWSKTKALSFFKKAKEVYKEEIINSLDTEEVSIYRQGEWLDLCRGPHVKNLSQIGVIKVLHSSGSYWRGEETGPRMQRIYGTAFHSKPELKQHLQNLKEAAERDHRKLGKEMGLFHFSDLSPGSPFFTASGAVIYNELTNFLRQMYLKYNYEEVITPQIFNQELFSQSGHKEHFEHNMYPVQAAQKPPASSSSANLQQAAVKEFFLKPMNCPSHCLLYALKKFSYRDLPWRVADFGRLHRREKTGVLHGLTRVRSMCQDDAHIFCTKEQLFQEIKSFLSMLSEVYHALGLKEWRIALSTRPDSFMGEKALWTQAEEALSSVLKAEGVAFQVEQGEGAFYGPKLDVMLVDSMKRAWQMGTLQCDFNMPKAFHLKYTDSQNQMQHPVLLHRAILGTLERFIGVYLEHTAGHLPVWLAPVQVLILNISQDQEPYVKELKTQMMAIGLRVKADLRSETLGYKIRHSRMLRIPCLVVVGKEEQNAESVALRLPSGRSVSLHKDRFIQEVKKACTDKKQKFYEGFSG